jgi:hypothetical protein
MFRNTITWVGQKYRLTNITTTQSMLCEITARLSDTTCTARFTQGIMPVSINFGVVANSYWEEGAWSFKNGFPKAVCAYGNRILYMGTTTSPNRVWASAVGDVDELCSIPYVQDTAYATYLTDNSRAFYFDIQGADIIRWAKSGKRVFVGATTKEFVIFAPGGAFGPTDYQIDEAGSSGSISRQPLKVGSEILHVSGSGQRVKSIVFSFQEDDYSADDITTNAEHISRKSISNIAEASQIMPTLGPLVLQRNPDPRIWATDVNGGLLSATYDRNAKIVAWSRHLLGGTPIGTDYGITTPLVAAITALRSVDGICDEIILVVKRKINGASKVYLEKIGAYFNGELYSHDGWNPLAGYNDYMSTRAVFLDCAQGSYPIAPTTTFTFSNMANETVHVVADGQYLGTYLLSSGGVLTLTRTYTEVIIGFKYTTLITTVNYVVPGSPAGAQGKNKLLYELWLRFNRVSHCKVKKSEQTDYQTIPFVLDSMATDGIVDLFTGDKRVHVGNVDSDLSVTIMHDYPFPFELLALIFKTEIS